MVEFLEAWVVSAKEEGLLTSVKRSAMRETARSNVEEGKIPSAEDPEEAKDIEEIYEEILRKHDIPIIEDVDDEP